MNKINNNILFIVWSKVITNTNALLNLKYQIIFW